ncbi:MAG: phosphopantothenoylcysteine decarboxylase [Puniceicoccales bacterium]|jgi:phosphopantothenoylcysteine synthetase/decarboxylase|nr:phosphopantothenoylcysteine decarboxylase [Puniceicoccales bacterium]
MPPLKGKTVVLGVTGSIAGFKAADIASQLVKLGADTRVVMTREAERFITPLTLQTLSRNPVAGDLWAPPAAWEPEHIALAERADLLLVAPATAHILACFAHGLAPDLLTCVYLATRAPVLLAPAMNSAMLEHPATRANLETLRARGNEIIEPASGVLACGTTGNGRLAPVDEIIARVTAALTTGGTGTGGSVPTPPRGAR